MLSKSGAISLLSADFDKNCCLIEVLKHDKDANLIYAENDGILILNNDNIAFCSIFDDNAIDKILQLLPNVKCVHSPNENFMVKAQNKLQLKNLKKCYQAYYVGEKLQENSLITIDKMDANDYNIEVVKNHYTLGYSNGPIKNLIENQGMFMAKLDGVPCGFIGFHSELSIGLLEVFDGFKNRGIGSGLLKFLINYCIDIDRLPFCHIASTNQISYNMCKKVGLTFYKDFVFWLD